MPKEKDKLNMSTMASQSAGLDWDTSAIDVKINKASWASAICMVCSFIISDYWKFYAKTVE